MQVRVRLFAVLREEIGAEELELELPLGATAGSMIEILAERSPHLSPLLARCLIAVNGNYEWRDKALLAGDEVAVLPPVSGG